MQLNFYQNAVVLNVSVVVATMGRITLTPAITSTNKAKLGMVDVDEIARLDIII